MGIILIFIEKDYQLLINSGMPSNQKPFEDIKYNTPQGEMRIRSFKVSKKTEVNYNSA